VRAGLTQSKRCTPPLPQPPRHSIWTIGGQIAAGKRADLVLVNGDPTGDIRLTRDIVAVWKAGHPIDREAWKATVAKQVEDADESQDRCATGGVGIRLDCRFRAGWRTAIEIRCGLDGLHRPNGRRQIGGQTGGCAGGPEGSKNALRVTGEVTQGFAYRRSGAMFSPGPTPMAPVNLSARKAIQFWAKGDGQTYQLMLFSQRLGYRPATQNFVAGPSGSSSP